MRSRFVRTLQIGLATAIAMVGLGVAAAPAQAVTTCSATQGACIWPNANYGGTRFVIQGIPCTQFPAANNNNTTSLKMGTGSGNTWTFYINNGCDPSGGYITYFAGTNIADLAAAVDNKFSSAGPGTE